MEVGRCVFRNDLLAEGDAAHRVRRAVACPVVLRSSRRTTPDDGARLLVVLCAAGRQRPHTKQQSTGDCEPPAVFLPTHPDLLTSSLCCDTFQETSQESCCVRRRCGDWVTVVIYAGGYFFHSLSNTGRRSL